MGDSSHHEMSAKGRVYFQNSRDQAKLRVSSRGAIGYDVTRLKPWKRSQSQLGSKPSFMTSPPLSLRNVRPHPMRWKGFQDQFHLPPAARYAMPHGRRGRAVGG